MVLSIFLAKVLGLYLTIVSLGLLLKWEKLRPMMLDLLKDPGMVFLTGILALIFGLLIVVSHNVWVMGWPVIITIIGWLSVFKGVARFVAPDMVIKKTTYCLENHVAFKVTMLLSLLLGVVLLYFGFMH